MTKRAQIVIFALIGIALLLTATIIVFTSNRITLSNQFTSPQGAVQLVVDSCLDSVSAHGLVLMGLQGGYTQHVPIPYVAPSFDIGYSFYEGVDSFPDLERFGIELSDFVEEHIEECVSNARFEDQGVDFEFSQPTAQTSFSSGQTRITLDWPMVMKQDQQQWRLSSFQTSHPVRFDYIHQVMVDVVKKFQDDPTRFDITQVTDSGLSLVAQPINDDVLLLIFTDDQSVVLGEPYVFVTVSKFSFAHQLPHLEPINPITVRSGEQKKYQVISQPSGVKHELYLPFGFINESTGLITFSVPSGFEGTYTGLVVVEDQQGFTDTQTITVEVVS